MRTISGWIKEFEWESETQKKGFLALVQFMNQRKAVLPPDATVAEVIDDSINTVACWFIQKDHESNEWYNERFGDMNSRLENEILALRKRIEDLESHSFT